MRWLLFLSRVAFIGGIFIVLGVCSLKFTWLAENPVAGTVLSTGYIFGFCMIPIINLCYLAVLFIKRGVFAYVPAWLVWCNIIFLLFLLFYIFYLNDPYYNQG